VLSRLVLDQARTAAQGAHNIPLAEEQYIGHFYGDYFTHANELGMGVPTALPRS
jgi:hypothetical protein